MTLRRWFGGVRAEQDPAPSPVPGVFGAPLFGLAALLLLVGSWACIERPADAESADATGTEAIEPPRSALGDGPRFPGSASSLDALGRTALEAVIRGDTLTLEGLRLTEHEHNDVVWPELPASAPELNFPVDFAWKNIQLRNRAALDRILPRYRDWRVTYEGIDCQGRTEVFKTFQVHTDCAIRLTTEDGVALSLPLFEDALERDGGFKLFRYYDHEPRRLDRGAP